MTEAVEYLTTEEAARLLTVHVNTIIRWIKSDKLSASQIGREYCIPRQDYSDLRQAADEVVLLDSATIHFLIGDGEQVLFPVFLSRSHQALT